MAQRRGVDEIEEGKGVGVKDYSPPPHDGPPKADFSDLAGRWGDDPGFDEVIASQRKVDWAKWR